MIVLDSPEPFRYHLSRFLTSTLAIDQNDHEEVVRIPNTASAKKRLRQSLRRRGMNRTKKTALKRIVKEIRRNLDTGDQNAARALIPQLAKAADKAAKGNAIHRNKAARIKSRWTKKVQGL